MQEINLLALVAVLALPACGPQTKKNKKAALQKAAFSLSEIQTQIDIHQNVQELEAKLTDIPTIIGSRTISLYQLCDHPQQLRMQLECDQSLAEVDAYYAEQMLYNGWQQVTVIRDSQEIMQVYKKPSKLCIIRVYSTITSRISLFVSDVPAEHALSLH